MWVLACEAQDLLCETDAQNALDELEGDDDEAPSSAEQSQTQKACAACDGWGTISTGIDEAPSTNCKKCDGTGKVIKP
ncbi:hypothetical protein D3C72_2392140 [compost metagenome]